MEVQLNGGSVADKVDFARKHFEQSIPVTDVFAMDECIDVIGVTKGRFNFLTAILKISYFSQIENPGLGSRVHFDPALAQNRPAPSTRRGRVRGKRENLQTF